jgi:predicted HTH transcriptional regulator
MDEQYFIEFKSQLRKMQKEGFIKRIGPAKGGYWKVENEKNI